MEDSNETHSMHGSAAMDRLHELPNISDEVQNHPSEFLPYSVGEIDCNNINIKVRLLVENEKVGKILGTGGLKVNAIRAQSGAAISILDVNGDSRKIPEQIVFVEGHISQIEIAINLICNAVADAKIMDFHQVTLLSHQSLVGAVIGRGGSTIKRTNSVTGANIHISSETLPDTTEKTITVYGQMCSVAQALVVVVRQLSTQEMHSDETFVPYEPQESHSAIVQMKPRKPLNKENTLPLQSGLSDMPAHGHSKSSSMPSLMPFDEPPVRIGFSANNNLDTNPQNPQMSSSYGSCPQTSQSEEPVIRIGFDSDRNLDPIPQMSNTYGSSAPNTRYENQNTYGSCAQTSQFDESVIRIGFNSNNSLDPMSQMENMPSDLGPNNQTIRALPQDLGALSDESSSVGPTFRTVSLVIPNGAVGQIIGKRGTGITLIKQQTGTHINIAQPEKHNPRERTATIKGTSSGVQMALYWINQLLDVYYGSDGAAIDCLDDGGQSGGKWMSDRMDRKLGPMGMGGGDDMRETMRLESGRMLSMNEYGMIRDVDRGSGWMGMEQGGGSGLRFNQL